MLYGILSDNLVLFGSRKKSYIILGGCIQLVTLQIIFWFETSIGFFAILMMLLNLSTAFMDVIVDSMMVIQSRHDIEKGSEKL